MRRLLWLSFALALVAAVFAAPGGAVGGFQVHGIGLAKGCQSPTKIGDPYLCLYVITNNQDTAHDSLTFDSIVDNVHAFGGDVSQGNIISSLTWHLSGGAFCDGIPVNGTGQVTVGGKCTLPYLGTATSDFHSQYSPTGADYVNLPQHTLRDTVQLTWRDTCVPSDGTPASSNCVGNTDFFPSTGSQSLIEQFDSIVWTEIHTPQEQAVIVIGAGATVHDFVTVTGEPGKPNPSGDVTIDWFLNSDCSGSPQSNSGPLALNGDGQVNGVAFSQGPLAAGLYGVKVHYLGDPNYKSSDGVCEPLRVVDANIQITPASADNPVGTNHTLTGHVNVNDGTGFVNAPANTLITFTITNGPGSFVGGTNTCNTVGATGSCTVQITSAVAGTTTISASTTVTVGGVPLSRTTNGQAGNSGTAAKLWADDSVRTDIHNAAHSVIITAASGDVVHDKVFVTRTAGTPAGVADPTGNVVFHRYTTIGCTGTPIDQTVALGADGTAESSTFTVTTDMSYRAEYLGDANYPSRLGACEPLSVTSPPKGHIMHTQVTCSDFVSNNPSDELTNGEYGVKNNTVNNVAPGVMFYYITITAPSASFTVNVTQSNDKGWKPIPAQSTGQIILYESNCAKSSKGTSTYNAATGTATIQVTGATPGATYIVGIKYSLSDVAGQPVAAPFPVVTYSFATNFNGGGNIPSSEDTIIISPKP